MLVLWWTECHWNRGFIEYFYFSPVSNIPPLLYTHSFSPHWCCALPLNTTRQWGVSVDTGTVWVASAAWCTVESCDHKVWEALVWGTGKFVLSGERGLLVSYREFWRLVPGTLSTGFIVTNVRLVLWFSQASDYRFALSSLSPSRGPSALSVHIKARRIQGPYVIWQLLSLFTCSRDSTSHVIGRRESATLMR
jgi:hypothetical protein